MPSVHQRHEAPVIRIPNRLAADEAIVLAMGLIPNRKSQPVVQHWFGIRFRHGEVQDVIEDVDDIVQATGLGRDFIQNTGPSIPLPSRPSSRKPSSGPRCGCRIYAKRSTPA